MGKRRLCLGGRRSNQCDGKPIGTAVRLRPLCLKESLMSVDQKKGASPDARALSANHRHLLEQLRRLLGDAPADWFHDALQLAIPLGDPVLRSPTYVVAVLLEQVEARLCAILLPADFEPGRSADQGSLEIVEIARLYPLSAEEIQRWQHCRRRLRRVRLESNATDEASDLLGEYSTLYGCLLGHLVTHFEKVLRKIDLLPLQPEVSAVQALLRSLPETEVIQERLLKKLPADGRYLDVLRLAGFFQRPPAPVRDENGKVRYHPSWPASRYLVDVVKQFPTEVGAILNDLPLTDNYLVRIDLAKAACQVPTPMLIPWLRRELPWFLQHRAEDEELEDALGNVAGTLIEREEFGEASSVLRQLLEYPIAKSDEPNKRQRQAHRHHRVWYARGILSKQIPLLIQMQPQQAFDLLSDVLCSVQRWHGADGLDYLSFSRRRIAAAPARKGWDDKRFETELVDQFIATAGALAVGKLNAVMQSLKSKPGDFFRRVALHLLRGHPEPQMTQTIKDALLDEQAFSEGHLEPEYGDLLAAQIGVLSRAEQGRIWGWLHKGPPEEELERLRVLSHPDVQAAEIKEHTERWRYRWMRRLQSHLPATLRPEYERLHGKYAPAAQEAQSNLLSPKELLELDQATLLARLQELPARLSKQREYGPSQADKLREAVEQDPRRFVEKPGMFLKLDAEYQGTFFDGLHSALSKSGLTDDDCLPLSSSLLLAADLVKQAKPEDWQYIDLGISRVLHAALVRRERPLVSIAEFDRVFLVLEALLRRPHEIRDRRRADRTDYPTLLLNTARGLALSSLFATALWKKRDLAAHGSPDSTLNVIWGGCEALLANLLAEGDPLVHASLGEQFWRLRFLDERWLQQNVSRIFPTEPEKQAQFEAAWAMFLSWSGAIPDEDWLALLRPCYDHALRLRRQQLAERSAPEKEKKQDRDHSLGADLGALYLYGSIDLAAGDLLDLFYAQADDEDAKAVVSVLLHKLQREGRKNSQPPRNDDDEEEDDTSTDQIAVWVQRARSLWQYRHAAVLAYAKQAGQSEEAAAFTHLFLLECFPAEETFAALELLLPIAALNAWNSAVLKRLATLAPAYPGHCLRTAREFFSRGGYPQPGSTRSILQAALHCADRSVEKDARALLNQLLAGGSSGFDDLLREEFAASH